MTVPTARLTGAEALALRMRSLLLHPADPQVRAPDVAGVVTWFGAMQAQDLASGLWSLGVRLPTATEAEVVAALERREALRTWPMRGTIHLVPSRDARWMVDLMGPRVLAGAAARRTGLAISDADAERAVEVLASALSGGRRLRRSECLAVLEESGQPTTGQRGYHLLWYAAQRAVTCLAPNVDGEQTFVLLDDWVPDPARPDRDEALGILALRYFRSHGPTTLRDFAGWTGLTMADVRRGIEVAAESLATVTVDGAPAHLPPEVLDAGPPPVAPDPIVLPGFDEYLLGYKDRSLMVDAGHMQAIIPGGNGVFRSTIVRDGRVTGTWKRAAGKVRTKIEVWPLVEVTEADRRAVAAAFGPYQRFIGREVTITWASN